jgi:predicted DNA-binding transcriptional regulator YafY
MTSVDGSFTANASNLNISAYRVLYILLHLVRFQALNVMEINHLLSENALIAKTFHEETISSYINTLRKLGCPIQRPSSRNGFKYQLKYPPFPLHLNDEELEILQKLLILVSSQPDEELHIEFLDILQKIKWALPSAKQELLMLETNPLPLHASVEQHRELLRKYRKLCRDALVLKVVYEVDGGANTPASTTLLTIEPSQVVQEGQRLYLVGVDREKHQRVKLNLEKIVSHRQLPSKIEHRLKPVNIVFQLTGRLAKTYRLYPDETVVEKTKTTFTIRAKTSDYASLLTRLLKYGIHCEVLSPAYIRQEMKQHVERLLSGLSQESPSRTE